MLLLLLLLKWCVCTKFRGSGEGKGKGLTMLKVVMKGCTTESSTLKPASLASEDVAVRKMTMKDRAQKITMVRQTMRKEAMS